MEKTNSRIILCTLRKVCTEGDQMQLKTYILIVL